MLGSFSLERQRLSSARSLLNKTKLHTREVHPKSKLRVAESLGTSTNLGGLQVQLSKMTLFLPNYLASVWLSTEWVALFSLGNVIQNLLSTIVLFLTDAAKST